jgi:hypothetical protein
MFMYCPNEFMDQNNRSLLRVNMPMIYRRRSMSPAPLYNTVFSTPLAYECIFLIVCGTVTIHDDVILGDLLG